MQLMRSQSLTPFIKYGETHNISDYYKKRSFDLFVIFDNTSDTSVSYTLRMPYEELHYKNDLIFGDICPKTYAFLFQF